MLHDSCGSDFDMNALLYCDEKSSRVTNVFELTFIKLKVASEWGIVQRRL